MSYSKAVIAISKAVNEAGPSKCLRQFFEKCLWLATMQQDRTSGFEILDMAGAYAAVIDRDGGISSFKFHDGSFLCVNIEKDIYDPDVNLDK